MSPYQTLTSKTTIMSVSNKTFLMSVLSILGTITMSFRTSVKEVKPPIKSIYDIEISSIEHNAIDLSQFKGKKILFVNVASKCGFTPQYAELQKLNQVYGEELVIIGIPCNQFMNQEPGSSEEIVEFCQKNYGVSFLITEKTDVKGANQHPLYTWLTSKELNGSTDSKVKWNFQKYLVNESGELLEVFLSNVNPMDAKITSHLGKGAK
ncbi:MAG: glutathione peroxidase [Vicingaceae bacterium]|jgi:glutathione peroxidase